MMIIYVARINMNIETNFPSVDTRSFDARGKPLQQAVHWADESVFTTKAHFHYDSHPPSLRIKAIKRTDAGLYRCRVDFQKSPTRNWRINLSVLGKLFAEVFASRQPVTEPYALWLCCARSAAHAAGHPRPHGRDARGRRHRTVPRGHQHQRHVPVERRRAAAARLVVARARAARRHVPGAARRQRA